MLIGIAAIIKALAWPIVACVAIYKFNSPIEEFLRRIIKWKVGATGAEGELLPAISAQQDATTPKIDENELTDTGSGAPPPDPFLDKISAKARDNIEKRFPGDKELQLQWTSRYAAMLSVERSFEIIYRIIFGSQIDLIYRANTAGIPATRANALHIFEEVRKLYPENYKETKFDDWIKFPITQELIDVENIGTSNEQYIITEAGKRFLRYIVEAGLPSKTL